MSFFYSDEELQEMEYLSRSLDEAVNDNRVIEWTISEAILEDALLPDDIVYLKKDILSESDSQQKTDGPSLIAKALGIGAKQISRNTLSSPRKMSKILRLLKGKLTDMEDREARARAEERGLIATVIYTIKSAIRWIVDKFRDLADAVYDEIRDTPGGYHSARRDFKDTVQGGIDLLSKNGGEWLL